MASRPNGGGPTERQVHKSLADMLRANTHYVTVVVVDGVATHFTLQEDLREASEWSVAKDVKGAFNDALKEMPGKHYARMTIGIAIGDPTPGLPTSIMSIGQPVQTWAIGDRPMSDIEMRRSNDTAEKKEPAAVTPAGTKKTTSRKKATSKASSKKSSSKAKTASKKTVSSRRKTPTKAVASKKTTSRRKATTRRSR